MCEEDDNIDPQIVQNHLTSNAINTHGLGDPRLVLVPSHPPLTRKQFDEGKKYWPTSFHENKEYVY